jgi:hypothetical protein
MKKGYQGFIDINYPVGVTIIIQINILNHNKNTLDEKFYYVTKISTMNVGHHHAVKQNYFNL